MEERCGNAYHSKICRILICGSGSVVERCLAKANVAGSNPVFRSIFRYHRQAVRQRSAKPLFPGSNPGGTSKKKSRASDFFFLYFSLFSFHSSLFLNFSTRLFQRRDKKEERKEKEAFLLPLKSIKLYLGSNPSIKKVKYLFYRSFTKTKGSGIAVSFCFYPIRRISM